MKLKINNREIRVRKRGIITIAVLACIIYLAVINTGGDSKKARQQVSTFEKPANVSEKKVATYPKETKGTTIKISAAGDFTIGSDETFPYPNSFNDEAKQNGLPFFIEHISTLFSRDDLTTVNLETPLTTATAKAAKKFRFKGDPSYTKILQLANIEAVNLANNHTYDYLEQGYKDTIRHLGNANIGYFGNGHNYIKEIKGIKVGALGYEGWDDTQSLRLQIHRDIQALKKQGAAIVIVHFHWGVERSEIPLESQQALARYTIDSGASVILGHHPHVVQGIEEYKGKFIVYSLGNFMFGGNKNPSDKDTFVFQQTFHFKSKKLTDKKDIAIIPYSISSITSRNNYQPKPLEGSEKDRVMNKILERSSQISKPNWLVYNQEIK